MTNNSPRRPKPLPAEYTAEGGYEALPARVIYTPTGMVPQVPVDLDMPAPVTVAATGSMRGHKLANGLTRKADAMARMVARGIAAVDAYRAVYGISTDPKGDTQRASRIACTGKFGAVVIDYRNRLLSDGRQNHIRMRDFVLGRLTLEAQTARESGSRIRALDLLGKSEGMWTTVHRTEKSMTPKDMKELKGQLEQRLRAALSKYSPGLGLSMTEGPGHGPAAHTTGMDRPDQTDQSEPHQGISPLNAKGDPTISAIPFHSNNPPPSISWVPSPESSSPLHREMSIEDL